MIHLEGIQTLHLKTSCLTWPLKVEEFISQGTTLFKTKIAHTKLWRHERAGHAQGMTKVLELKHRVCRRRVRAGEVGRINFCTITYSISFNIQLTF